MLNIYQLMLVIIFFLTCLGMIYYLYYDNVIDEKGFSRIKINLLMFSWSFVLIVSDLVVLDDLVIDSWWKTLAVIICFFGNVWNFGFLSGIAFVMVVGSLIDLIIYTPVVFYNFVKKQKKS